MVQANNALPLLDQVQIASPCTADWNAMTGDERSRFCGQCNKHVYNLSAMTRDEAETLITEHEGKLCGRLYRRADGTVLTSDCPVGVTTIRRRIRGACVAIVLLGATLLAGALQACGMRQTARGLRESGALTRMRNSVTPRTFFALGAVAIPACSPPVSTVPIGSPPNP